MVTIHEISLSFSSEDFPELINVECGDGVRAKDTPEELDLLAALVGELKRELDGQTIETVWAHSGRSFLIKLASGIELRISGAWKAELCKSPAVGEIS